MKAASFVFNLYQENTYILIDESKDCVIIDPGCYSLAEKQKLTTYITEQGLNPVYLLNTHGHIDHMLGNDYVKKTYKIPFLTHQIVDEIELPQVPAYASSMGLNPDPSPKADKLLNAGDTVVFGNTTLEVLFTPGHSPGHISFFHRESQQLFAGDVLFSGSIGRVDLPGGNYETLMESIVQHILPLGDEVVVYPGHGPTTTVGRERMSNPFVLDYLK